jgi:hypothetical protein
VGESGNLPVTFLTADLIQVPFYRRERCRATAARFRIKVLYYKIEDSNCEHYIDRAGKGGGILGRRRGCGSPFVLIMVEGHAL